jgi:hypothetical protein
VREDPVTDDPVSDARAAAARGEFESAVSRLRPVPESGNPEARYYLGLLALTECDLVSGRAGGSEYADRLLAHLESLT